MNNGAAAIILEGVNKSFGDTQALRDLNLAAPAGRITGLLGPNGAGKTTALEICAGLHPPTSGRVEVLGSNPWQANASHRARVGVMLQSGGIWSGASAEQSVTHVARLYQNPIDPGHLLRKVHLDHVGRTPYRRLSGGEQQRVKLACAVVGRPKLVILDEPSSGLDPATRRDIWQLIRGLREAGTTVVLSTHALEEAEELSDWIVIVDQGQCVASGTTSDLTSDPDSQTLRFRASAHLNRTALLRALPTGFELAEDTPGQYRLSGSEISPTIIASVTAWCAEQGVLAAEMTVSRRNLEQVFMEVTAHTKQVTP